MKHRISSKKCMCIGDSRHYKLFLKLKNLLCIIKNLLLRLSRPHLHNHIIFQAQIPLIRFVSYTVKQISGCYHHRILFSLFSSSFLEMIIS